MKQLFFAHSLYCPNDCDKKPAAVQLNTSLDLPKAAEAFGVHTHPVSPAAIPTQTPLYMSWTCFRGRIWQAHPVFGPTTFSMKDMSRGWWGKRGETITDPVFGPDKDPWDSDVGDSINDGPGWETCSGGEEVQVLSGQILWHIQEI